MSWLKKGALLRLAGGLAVLFLLVFFFFDPLLKYALVRAGRSAAGAKVEISSVKSKWLRGTLEIRGVAVADRNAPMKNAVEFSRAGFRLDIGAALRGKGVIREAAIEGLRLGTPRTTSGALPHPPAPSKLELAIREKLAPVSGAATGAAAEIKSNAVGQVDATKLQGLKKLDEVKARAAAVEERWKGKKAEADQIAKEAQEIGRGDLLTQAQKVKDLIARVDAQRRDAQKDLAEIQDAVKQADEWRGKDLNGLLAAAGLPTLDPDDLARRLLGAQTASRLGTALHWLRWARERAAANKRAASAAPPPPQRRQGLDIEFPIEHADPQFLLEQAKLSGSLDHIFLGQDLAIKGVLDGVTSNPTLYGKAATLKLSGAAPGGVAMNLTGRLDQQNDPVGAALNVSAIGLSLAGTPLGDAEIGGEITGGEAQIVGEIHSVGDEWSGDVGLQASRVKIEPKVALSGPAGAAVSDALKSLNFITVNVVISGKEDALQLTLSSNLGRAVAEAMKKAVSGQLDARRKAVSAQVNALYDEKLKGVRAQTDGLSAKILAPLDAQRSGLDRLLQDSLKKSIGGKGVPDLKRLFK